MLQLIAKALTDFNEKGLAIITSREHDVEVVGDYVVGILTNLKCSFDHYYNPIEDSYFIEDRMMEN